MWFWYAILGATFKSLGHLNRKQLAHTSSLAFTFLNNVLATALLLPVVAIMNLPVMSLMLHQMFEL